MPVGAHRRPPSRWRPVIPFLIILATVPLLAWGFSALLQRGGSEDVVIAQSETVEEIPQSEEVVVVEEEEPAQSATEDGQPSAAQEEPAEKSDEESKKESEKESEKKEVDYDTYVLVLNETGINGYAGEIAQVLNDGGFTNTAADNTYDWITEANTVFYSSEDQAATAEKVAELVGFSEVVLNADATGGEGIVVLLVN